MYEFRPYPYDGPALEQRLDEIKKNTGKPDREMLKKLVSFIDLTSLEGSDTEQRIIEICRKGQSLQMIDQSFPHVAAVCFYPLFIAPARKALQDASIEVASVAGAFPSGQSPLEVRVKEIEWAVAQGADEIDTVINRGKLLSGKNEEVFEELKSFREACGNAKMKVIIESGELPTVGLIRTACELAIQAGADFVKTSTGKIATGATPEAFLIMADTVKEYFQGSGRKIGLKAAGGISTPEDALFYHSIAVQTAGKEWDSPELFRIGASRLFDRIMEKLAG
ncbi:MAG: deoxyribose-phosphate aldolase [Bacteroidales bacterium]